MLCVDNDPNVLAGMVQLLNSWNCHVYQASSAQQAKKEFAKHAHKIDIVLMDYQLEDDQNGLNLMLELQQQTDLALPAILITATIDETVVNRAKELGYGYLRKIIKPIALRAVMSATLAKNLHSNYSASKASNYTVEEEL